MRRYCIERGKMCVHLFGKQDFKCMKYKTVLSSVKRKSIMGTFHYVYPCAQCRKNEREKERKQ